MRTLFLPILALVLLIACKPSASGDSVNTDGMTPKQAEDALMVIHDSAMVKLNTINRLSSQLRGIRAEVNVTSDQGADAYPAGLDKVLEDLKLADQGMWDWMKSYSDTKKTLKEDQLMPFFEKEMVKVQAVANAIDSSIINAQTWLTAHGTSAE
jgi:hypothetical protein